MCNVKEKKIRILNIRFKYVKKKEIFIQNIYCSVIYNLFLHLRVTLTLTSPVKKKKNLTEYTEYMNDD